MVYVQLTNDDPGVETDFEAEDLQYQTETGSLYLLDRDGRVVGIVAPHEWTYARLGGTEDAEPSA